MRLFGITLISDKKLYKLNEKAANVERLQNEIEKAEFRLEKSKQAIKDLNEALMELEMEVDSKDKEILAVGKDLSEKNNEIASLKNNVEILFASVKKKSEDFTEANNKLIEAEERIEKLEELDKANVKFISDLRYHIETLTKRSETNSIAKDEVDEYIKEQEKFWDSIMKEMDDKKDDEEANVPAEPLCYNEYNQSDEVLDSVPDWEMPKKEINPHDLIPEPAPDYPTQEGDHVDKNKEELGNTDTKEAPSVPNVQKVSSKVIRNDIKSNKFHL